MTNGEYIRLAMRSKGFSEKELSKRTGILPYYIQKYLSDEVKPTYRSAKLLAQELGIELNDIDYKMSYRAAVANLYQILDTEEDPKKAEALEAAISMMENILMSVDNQSYKRKLRREDDQN